jgi:non-ribosomal peptide synthetase component F
VQSADFAVWQHRELAGAALDAELAFWRRQLAGAPQVLELPMDHPRPARQSFIGGDLSLTLPAELAGRLQAVSRQHRATLFMTLLTAFAVLLRRVTGRRDLLIGSPIANRNRTETEGLIGFFVNMLPLRADLSGAPDFAQALDRIREMALGAYAHQDLPFERLVEELQPVRDLSRPPLFQVSFSMAGAPWQSLDLPGLTLSHLESGELVELHDLTLLVFQRPHGLETRLSYNTDLFEPFTIERLGSCLEVLLEAFAADPARKIDTVPLLTAGEREQILGTRPAEPAPQAQLVPDMIARQAAERPAAPALLWEDGELSYEELDRRANRLAWHLRTLGVGPEVPVALVLDRTMDFGAALLAVWRAGGIAVPLDPEAPRERRAWMLADSGARAVVTRTDPDRAALARQPTSFTPRARPALRRAFSSRTEPSPATAPPWCAGWSWDRRTGCCRAPRSSSIWRSKRSAAPGSRAPPWFPGTRRAGRWSSAGCSPARRSPTRTSPPRSGTKRPASGRPE